MRNDAGEKFVKKLRGTNGTQKTKVLQALKEPGSDKYNDVSLEGSICRLIKTLLWKLSLLNNSFCQIHTSIVDLC